MESLVFPSKVSISPFGAPPETVVDRVETVEEGGFSEDETMHFSTVV